MTVPPRGSAEARDAVTNPRPIRYPEVTSPEVMTRRGWWLIVLNFLLPGSAQILAGNKRLGRIGLAATLALWIVAIVGIVLVLVWRGAVLSLAPNWFFLLAVQIILIAYVLLWVVLTIDTLRLARLVRAGPAARFFIAGVSVLLLLVASLPSLYAAQLAATTRSTITSIFGGGTVVPPSDGYYNILLLGADSGAGRDSMRFDSISVVSVNASTGATTITGIPRDLPNAPFSEGPMQELYPNGFEGHISDSCGWGSGINQLRNAAEVCREDRGEGLYPNAVDESSSPSIEATKDAAEGMLGIEIPYYVFIDMEGFAHLIDALGGVEITVTERLPEGPGPDYDGQPAEEWATGWIEEGTQLMDGETAQWYARSRYTTSDWDRMERQRILQQAILAQFTPSNVLSRFSEIMSAGSDLVQTDVPDGLLPTLLDLGLKAREQAVSTIELTPENGIDSEYPDYTLVRELVADALHPASPTAAPEE